MTGFRSALLTFSVAMLHPHGRFGGMISAWPHWASSVVYNRRPAWLTRVLHTPWLWIPIFDSLSENQLQFCEHMGNPSRLVRRIRVATRLGENWWPPDMAEDVPAAAATSRGRFSYQRDQEQHHTAHALREEFHARFRAKMDRVTAWVAECAAVREQHRHQADQGAGSNGSKGSSAVLLLEDCNGETEDLLLQVLIARPKYEGIPSVEEIQQFAGQLRAYHARLWTLRMTKGLFRAGAAATASGELASWEHAAEYPDDIDSLESGSMQEGQQGHNWVVHKQRVFVRKISPAEEELRDEMIQEYRNIRRHSLNDRGIHKQYRKTSVSNNIKAAPGDLTSTEKLNRAPISA